MGLKFSKEDIIEEVRVQQLPTIEDRDEIIEVLTDEPDNAEANLNYAVYLAHIEKKYDEAEQYFAYAVEQDRYSAKCIGFYALFLEITKKEIERAGTLYKKCYDDIITKKQVLGNDEVNFVCNYAVYYKNCLNDPNKADQLYKRLIAANPSHAIAHGDYALLLKDVLKEYDRAEDHFQKAVALAPDVAHWQLAYGNFLKHQKKDVKGSKPYFEAANKLKKVERSKEKESVKQERLRLKQEKKEQALREKEEAKKAKEDAKAEAKKLKSESSFKRSNSQPPKPSSATSSPKDTTHLERSVSERTDRIHS